MIDWEDYDVMTVCLFLFNQSIVLILGVYVWEFAISFPEIDLRLITRRIKFRWLFIPYLLGRYGLLASLFTLTVYLHTTKAIDCPVLGRVFSVFTTMTVVCASTNLMIRTLVLWLENRYIFWGLILANVAHWSVIFIAAFGHNTSEFDPTRTDSCLFDHNSVLLFSVYTISFDLLTLILTILGLRRNGVLWSHTPSLWTSVFEQGVGYFTVTCLVNLPTLVLSALNLNTVMTIICVIPAACVSVICSSRAVSALMHSSGVRSRSSSQIFTSYRSRSPNGVKGSESLHGEDGLLTTDIHLHTFTESTPMSSHTRDPPRRSPASPPPLSPEPGSSRSS